MDKRYNILLIMADQLTPFMTGAYGNKQVMTPNLDRLCREGIRFENAYTSCPLCAPARASMMTSRLCSELDCYDNASPFASDEPTFAHYAKLAGYDTVLSGKMHFLGPDQLHGFNRRLTTDIYPGSFNWYPVPKPSFEDEGDPSKGHKAHYPEDWFGKPKSPDAPPPKYPSHAVHYSGDLCFPTESNLYVNYDDETFFRAKEYIHGNFYWDPDSPSYPGKPNAYGIGKENAHEPFCLVVSTHNPHDPFMPPKKYWDLYKDMEMDAPSREEIEACPQNIQDIWINAHENIADIDLADPYHLQNARRAYAALATYVDDRIGELLNLLEDEGLMDNTVIMFTSDHGDMLIDRGMIQKRNFHEWATRIPMILRLPGQEHAGTTITDPCSLMDIGMTIREITGTLNASRLPSDGVSLFDYINKPESVKERDIFIEFHADGTFWPCYAVVRGGYKLIHIHEFKGQLFNLREDPSEMHDLIDEPQYASLVESMRKSITDRFHPEHIIEYYTTAHEKKRIIDSANNNFDEDWDYTPDFPGGRRYIRTLVRPRSASVQVL